MDKTEKTIDLVMTILILLQKYGAGAWDLISNMFGGITEEEIDARLAYMRDNPAKTADEVLAEIEKEEDDYV